MRIIVTYLEKSSSESVACLDCDENNSDSKYDLLQHQISLILCTSTLLLNHCAAHKIFTNLNGYNSLYNTLTCIISRIGLNYFSLCRKEKVGVLSNADSNIMDDAKINVSILLLSLIFGRPLNANIVEEFGNMTYTASVQLDLLVKNMAAVKMVVDLVKSCNGEYNVVGLNAMKYLLRLCPLSVIALEKSDAIASLGDVVVKNSLIPSIERNSECIESVYCVKSKQFDLFRSACNILARVAVLNSEVNINVLSFFVCILHENSLFHHRSSLSRASSSPSQNSPIPTCSNCETEMAVFECTDGSCICDEMFHLCAECDKVFHKSALKRSHIRLPIIEITSHTQLWKTMGTDFTNVLQREMSICSGSSNMFNRNSERFIKERVAFTSCLLLSHVNAILDDRKVHM